MRRGTVGGSWLACGLFALFAACGTTSLKPPPPSSGGTSGGSTPLPFGGQTNVNIDLGVDTCAGSLPPTPLTRWSIPDLDNTLDLFFPPGPRLVDSLSPEVDYQRDVSASFVRALYGVASARVEALSARPDSLPACPDDDGSDAECVQTWLSAWGLELYRRPLSSEQLAAYSVAFESKRAQSSATEAAKNTIVSMLLSPYFVLRIELGTSADSALLTAYEVAARLSHFAALSSPDAELSALAASGEILMRPQLLAQLHRLWQLPAGRAARRLQILQWLGLSTPLRRDDLDAELSADMDAQLASLIDDVLENQDASLTKLLTSRRQLVSNALAEHYGLPVPAEESVDLADLSPTPYAGALSTGPFLSRYRGPSERGLRIREALLCQPLSPHPPGDYPLGAGATPRERITAAVAGKTGCAPCHQLVDPLGFALEAFDDQGSLTGFDTTGAFQSLVTSATTPLSGPLDLGTQIAQSQEGLSCAARRYLEYALDTSLPVTTEARIALSGPSNPADDWTNCLSLVLNTNKGSLAAMSESIVSSVLMLTRADPARYVVAFDTSVDPLEHAYQETLQFRQVFPTSAEELVISAYAEALRQASQGLEAGGDGGAAGAGGASTGTAGHAGAP